MLYRSWKASLILTWYLDIFFSYLHFLFWSLFLFGAKDITLIFTQDAKYLCNLPSYYYNGDFANDASIKKSKAPVFLLFCKIRIFHHNRLFLKKDVLMGRDTFFFINGYNICEYHYSLRFLFPVHSSVMIPSQKSTDFSPLYIHQCSSKEHFKSHLMVLLICSMS